MNKIVDSQNANIVTIREAMKVKENKTAKLVKPAKVSIWNKEMTFAVYLKALEAWMEQNKDISEHVRFQDVIESLKMNKDVNGLAKYVGEHILPVLDTVETQTVMQIVGILKRKYGRTRIEELKELMKDWMNFKANEYEDEDEYLFAMEKLIARKEEKKVKDKEWNSIWMMVETKKRKGMENYQIQELRNVVKANGDDVMKDFRDKYRELMIESNRGKAADTFYIGRQSLSRQ